MTNNHHLHVIITMCTFSCISCISCICVIRIFNKVKLNWGGFLKWARKQAKLKKFWDS